MVEENYIIIPSKNIYSIDNQKVIDNLIDRIEVSAKTPAIIADTQNVYNKSIATNNITAASTQSSQGSYANATGAFPRFYQLYGTYNAVTPTYYRGTIAIPVNSKNIKILEVLTGENNEGEANIKISISGTYKKYNISGYANVSNVSDNTSFSIDSIEITGKNIVTENKGSYNLFHTDKEYENTFILGPTVSNKSSSTLYFSNSDNILITSFGKHLKNNVLYYSADLICLIGLEIVKLQLVSPNTTEIPTTISFPAGGVYSSESITTLEEYIPEQLTISLYGNVIKLDLQDNILTIGNGDNTYSFSGNELMQTTNTPTIEDTYGKVITQHKNGKEVATIKCNIDDYYDKDKDLAVSVDRKISIDKNSYFVMKVSSIYVQQNKFAGNYLGGNLPYEKLHVGEELFWVNGSVKITRLFGDNGIGVEGTKEMVEQVQSGTELSLSTAQISLPMTFHIGDTVVPYVYTAKGEDRPMSYYVDNTPKKFIVISKGISYRGRVYQNITLQEEFKDIQGGGGEIITPINPTATVEVGAIEQKWEETAKIELHLISGTLNIGDIIKYNGEEAEVYDIMDDTVIYINANADGKFEQALGQTITVEIVEKNS